MSQRTLTGESIELVAPMSLMQPSEKIIYNYLRACESGRTITQIRNALSYTKIGIFDNKLRRMRSMGWVKTWKPVDGADQLYFAVEVTR